MSDERKLLQLTDAHAIKNGYFTIECLDIGTSRWPDSPGNWMGVLHKDELVIRADKNAPACIGVYLRARSDG